ncbi:two-component sensor histidine kinase [Streptomyces spiroverticillatus]|uniref:histidine kinase n=1 Tax=Streptomyces finlayi TaxID=67296 RepID=A0A919CDB5_9ACTN|nr:histidine kinase [Streptomyces finlayi]GHA32799.1 two-component sensor histidine kinase [Streptomyces spiroverticillatus]GHD10322.1 two-component sensor histidine kinase [Streptomyces finlayi]
MHVISALRRDSRRALLLDLALWVCLSFFVTMKEDPNDGGSWPRMAAGVAALGLGVLLCRRAPLVSLTVTVACSALRSPELFTPSYTVAMCLFAFLAGRHDARVRPAVLVFAAYAAAGLALSLTYDDKLWVWFAQLTSLLLQVVVPWLIGRYVRRYAQLVANGWELADRMEREQRAVADRERLRERSRIAGDMHDSLGHELSLIAVRAAALEVNRHLPPAEQRAAGELRLAAADATARLRDIVGVLREDGEGAPTTPAGETVTELVRRAEDSGLSVELLEEGPELAVPDMVARAAHRVAQEALTNATKHAPGAPVRMRIVRDAKAQALSVTVTHPAPPGAAPSPGLASGGTGLVGLDERVRLAGGTLTHGPTPDGGFAVAAHLPLAGIPVPRTPQAPVAERELSRARLQVRRGLVQAIVAPAAVVAALGALMLAYQEYGASRSVLTRDQFDRVHLGERREALGELLPDHPLDGPPAGVGPEPAGTDTCTYFRTDRFETTPVYRLCFTNGTLAAKDLVDDVPNEELR